jgi:ABC-2 type transport system permease protein
MSTVVTRAGSGTAFGTVGRARHGLTLSGYAICMRGILWREGLRFVHQRGRFLAALVRPLVWLVIFAAGWRQVLGVSIMPPYHVYILYSTYVVPGLLAMIQFFYGMQSSLSLVYDREMGNMRVLLVSPFPRWFLLVSRLIASTAISLIQCYAFLVIAWLWGVDLPDYGWITVLPALILSGFMLSAMGMVLSSCVRQLENFAGVMNFVIFPLFFASSALYPLWQVQQSSPLLYQVCLLNPFTWAVELIRFCLYSTFNPTALAVVLGCVVVFTAAAILAYDPARGLMARRQRAEA